MSDNQIEEISFSRVMGRYKQVAKAQAEVSFKAGIREVVEWIGEGCGHWDRDWCDVSGICDGCWQAKLKEWGIEM